MTVRAVVILAFGGLGPLVVGTGLQALGAAGMTVAAMSLAGSATAMGVVSASLAMFGASAPLIGSQVSDVLSWRAALILPLLSLLAVPAVVRHVRVAAERTSGEPTSPERSAGKPLDVVGAALLIAWVTGLAFLPQRPLEAAVGVVAATALLAWHLRRRPDGFVPPAVLRSRQFVLAAGLAFALAVGFSIIYAAPDLLTAQTGWSSSQLGVALLVPYLVGGAVPLL